MKLRELTEGLSSILYHYTRLGSAVNIISTGQFKLASTLGNNYETKITKDSYPFFLSTTRTKFGGYHDPYSDGVMFVLDGRYYSTRYKGSSVDYWGDKHKQHEYGRRHEAEDRIMSKEPFIPSDGILEVHVFVMPMTPEKVQKDYNYLPNQLRKLFIESKKKNIPIYLYDDKKAWFSQDKSKVIPVSAHPAFKGYKKPGRTYRSSDYIEPILELLYKKSRAELSKRADKILYNIRYYNDTSFDTDMFNARKPSSEGYDTLGKIVKFMRQNKIQSLSELREYIKKRWEDK